MRLCFRQRIYLDVHFSSIGGDYLPLSVFEKNVGIVHTVSIKQIL